MKNILREAPQVGEAFFAFTKSIRESSALDTKTMELVLVAIFASHRGLRGIGTHVERAREAGATKEEILSAILLATPVVGITNVTLAVEAALAQLHGKESPDVASAH
jgi:4-carboxymuconolactone decarboxylase